MSLAFDPEITQLLDTTSALVNIRQPGWYVTAEIRAVLEDRDDFDTLSQCLPLELSPTTSTILSSAAAPAFSAFLSLPDAVAAVSWGIYAVCMEKEGSMPKLYIGSGTDATNGVTTRMGSYRRGLNLPRLVKIAVDKGYHVSHVGLFCWTPLPPTGIVPRARAFFLALEATFTVLLHACIAMITNSSFEHLLLWSRSSVEWEPLCSHLSLIEAVRGDLTLTAEELEIAAARRTARAKEMHLPVCQASRARRRAQDPVAYKRNVTEVKKIWATKNPDRVLSIAAKVRTTAKNSKRFHCDVCDMSLATQSALDKHNRTQAHRDIVTGTRPLVLVETVANANQNAYRASRKASGQWSCQPCGKTFPNDWSLQRHLATSLHRKRCL